LIGWYQNGCACGEHVELDINYEGDVRQLHAFGFDGVKLDNCGDQRNMTKYAELMQATGKSYLIENCHWGRCSDLDISSCPTADWCPFNWFRTSGDINSSPMSWLYNLQTTKKFQDPVNPLSRPGCWAYPDMLEVGRIKGQDGKLDHSWNRAHFGAWCVVSAPLILGMDLTNDALVESVIDIISNKEAIAVNQAWAGHPGRLVWENSTNDTPAGANVESTLQAWAKPLPDGYVALLLVNPDSKAHEIEVPLNVLPIDFTGDNVLMRDIWEQKDLKPLGQGKTSIKVTVGGHDSAFLRLG